MPRKKLVNLVKKWRGIKRLELTDDEIPGIERLNEILTRRRAPLVVRVQGMDVSVGKTNRVALSGGSSVERAAVARHILKRMFVPVKPGLEPDTPFHPHVPMVNVPPQPFVKASVNARGRTVAFRLSRKFRHTAIVRISGDVESSGERLRITLWQSMLDVAYLVVAKHGASFAALVLGDRYHPGLSALRIDPPLVILASSDAPASKRTIPVERGLHVCAVFRFGQNLAAAVAQLTPRALISDEGNRFRSTPFTLQFAHTSLTECGLDIWLGRELDVMLQGRWGGRLGLKLWSELPPDGGMLSWNTDLPSPLDDDEQVDGSVLLDKYPEVHLSDLDDLVGSWDGWRTTGDDGALIQSLRGVRLAGYQLGVDTTTRAETSAILTLRADRLELRQSVARYLQIGPCVCRVVVIQPWDAGSRRAQLDVTVDARLGGTAFRGSMTGSSMMSFVPANGVDMNAMISLFQLTGPGTRAEDWISSPPDHFLVELAFGALPAWRCSASNGEQDFQWSGTLP